MPLVSLLRSLVVLAALTAVAQAQPADRTGTGGGPDSTITAPYTNREGVTKPPGTSLGPGEVPSPKAQSRERREIDKIEGSICKGC
ncbi:hypothetical protein [Methylobacterium dankookense]|uniref:Secreted protein n=1 Tax=Methylobacterium dankookense TaxID=560405 RepID=A0A564G2U6_9HYPH|nr:hypothetical protein [Methylobacterium dankookense]GJD55505.1 hypothetical protein IFDJLNFL_1391 [Methylobacterium dankookense]VUF14829.1 hypothetical protein MTDSW087_04555 [Methylobacterium dankookense]